MQPKTSDLHHTSVQIGLTINKQKTNILRINAGTDEPATIEGAELGEVESFTYLGSVMDKSGETDADVKTRIGKARSAYDMLKKVWNSRDIGTSTNARCVCLTQTLTQYCCMEQKHGGQLRHLEEDPDFYKSVLT